MEIRRKKMIFNSDEIKAILPHRYPFLLVDRIVEITDNSAIGIKNVTVNEPFFEGHFSNKAIMPGNLIAECLAQVSAFVGLPYQQIKEQGDISNPKQGFLTASTMKFQQPAIPGDSLKLHVQKKKDLSNMSVFYGEASVDGDIIAKGEFTVVHFQSPVKK